MIDRLSPRQRQVCEAAARGLTSKAIAVELAISAATVKVHLRNAMAVLDTPSRAALVNLFPPPPAPSEYATSVARSDDDRAILDLIALGCTNHDIAAALEIRVSNVQHRVSRMMHAIGSMNRTGLARWWLAQEEAA